MKKYITFSAIRKTYAITNAENAAAMLIYRNPYGHDRTVQTDDPEKLIESLRALGYSEADRPNLGQMVATPADRQHWEGVEELTSPIYFPRTKCPSI
jgi:hypothetical protein